MTELSAVIGQERRPGRKRQMIEAMECIRQRRSIRHFRPDAVAQDVVEKVVQAATCAPSAGNAQAWRFLIVSRRSLREGLKDAASGQAFVAEAPVVIVVCAEPGRSASNYGDRGRDLYCLQDSAAATMALLLAAHACGLGACWVGAFDEAAVRSLLQIPERYRPVAMVPVGHPNESPQTRWRRPLAEVVEHFA